MTHAELVVRIVLWRKTFPEVYAETVRRIGENPEFMDDDSGLLLFDSVAEDVYAEFGRTGKI